MPVRKCTDISPPQWSTPPHGEPIELRLKTITPMFGGGYEARNVDPVCIIRPAAIRGHLRFWWRATAGAQYATAEELFRAEEAIWGSAAKDGDALSGPGKVTVEVLDVVPGQEKPHSKLAPKSDPKKGPQEGVFLFPFQEQKGDSPAPEASGRVNVRFTLRVTCPGDSRAALEQTIRAWLLLGGVGARTRRGCGALAVETEADRWHPPAAAQERGGWLLRLIESGRPQRPRHSLLSGGRVIIGRAGSSPDAAWRQLGMYWSAVRKGHIGGEEEYSPINGAHWDDYRKTLVAFPHSQEKKISLAKPFLGLPIIYQKFDKGAKPARYAPTLEAEETGRMASPVILKPAALSDGSFAALVAVLNSPEPRKIRVKEGTKERPVELSIPQNDRVLRRMRASHPLDAVVTAAVTWFGSDPITLEVLP